MAASTHGPIGSSIVAKLTSRFSPKHVDVMNESYMHNVPKGAGPRRTAFAQTTSHCAPEERAQRLAQAKPQRKAESCR